MHEKEISRFSIDNCLSHSVEGVCGEFFRLSEDIWHREKLYIKGHYHHFLSKLFCLRVPKIFIREPFSVSESIDFREKFCIKGCYHDSDENCLSHSAEGFRGEPFFVSENVWYRKKFYIIREYRNFLSKTFCLIMPNVFVWKNSVYLNNSRIEKNLHKTGISQFLSNIFCLTMPKIFVLEPFSVSDSFA